MRAAIGHLWGGATAAVIGAGSVNTFINRAKEKTHTVGLPRHAAAAAAAAALILHNESGRTAAGTNRA